MKKLIVILAIILVGSVAFAETYYMSSMGNGNYMVTGGSNHISNTSSTASQDFALGAYGGFKQAGIVCDGIVAENFNCVVGLGVDYAKYTSFGGQMYIGYCFNFDKIFRPAILGGMTFGLGGTNYIATCGKVMCKFVIAEHFMPFVQADLGYAFIDRDMTGFYWDASIGATYKFF